MEQKIFVTKCGLCPMIQEHEGGGFISRGVSCRLGFKLDTKIIRGPVANLDIISSHCKLHKEKITIELTALTSADCY